MSGTAAVAEAEAGAEVAAAEVPPVASVASVASAVAAAGGSRRAEAASGGLAGPSSSTAAVAAVAVVAIAAAAAAGSAADPLMEVASLEEARRQLVASSFKTLDQVPKQPRNRRSSIQKP